MGLASIGKQSSYFIILLDFVSLKWHKDDFERGSR